MVRESEFKSEDPGFDPLAEQGGKQLFFPSESTFVKTRLCLSPLRVHGTHPNYAHVKDPVSICRVGVGLTASGMETGKHCRHGGKTAG